ncbi:hypothetical protein M0811_12526 [Anaeramoeba ignava]|uniref:PSI domain-containing protein n=1 Tax=Anaeramoeba ignava TaxID=1746090 RepID=A0A9Q0LA71_ANAIG|nr:hypothetical protein M0811_12526 [Anaeramoeba ignava]
MITFFYFLLIIGSVFSTTCTSKTKCTSCLDDIFCEWCETNKHCYDSTSDYDYCNDWKYIKSNCPGYLATILGAVFGAIAGLIILICCCVYCARRAQNNRLEEYRKSANKLDLKPVTITTTIQQPSYQPTYQEPTYQEPPYQPSYQPTYQEPSYQPNYQQPNFQLNYQEPNYQGPTGMNFSQPDNNFQPPNYQGPVGMNFPDFSTYNPQQNPTQNN